MHQNSTPMPNQPPPEASRAARAIQKIMGEHLLAVYLYGSAALGGLRPDSDLDLLVVLEGPLSAPARRELSATLLALSGRLGNEQCTRPLEVTVVDRNDIVPWQYPPRSQLLYGEWLRPQFETGDFSQPTPDPDLALLLAQARMASTALYGPPAPDLLAPVPAADITHALRDSLPGLVANLRGDKRNVLLTLARMWLTATTGDFRSKDQAAEWAAERLPSAFAALLRQARHGYLSGEPDHWAGQLERLDALAAHLRTAIIASLDNAT